MIYPDAIVKSVYALTPQALARRGVRALLLDIDNTLVEQDEPADERCIRFFAALHEAGIATFLVSNNRPERVEPFAKAVGSPYLCEARKPLPGGYREALRQLGLEPGEALAAGDQLFTDIWGAKLAGIRTVFVLPIRPRKDAWTVLLKRPWERLLLKGYPGRKTPRR